METPRGKGSHETTNAVSIHPGSIAGPMTATCGVTPDSPMPLAAIGQSGKPEEVAAAIVFAASDETSYMTGTEFVVDGGLALGDTPWCTEWRNNS